MSRGKCDLARLVTACVYYTEQLPCIAWLLPHVFTDVFTDVFTTQSSHPAKKRFGMCVYQFTTVVSVYYTAQLPYAEQEAHAACATSIVQRP